MKKIFFVLLSVGLMNTACTNSNEKVKKLETENQLLKDSIKLLHKDIEGYRNDPAKLCVRADEFYKNNQVDSLLSIFISLNEYHPESEEYKKISRMIDDLNAKQKKAEEEAEKERMAAVNKLRKEYDDIKHITWYYNPYFKHYNNTNKISLYIGQDKTNVWLRMQISYTGDDWIFFDEVYLSCDGDTYQVNFDRYKEKESDNGSGEVWEWIDVSATPDLQSFLYKMIKGKNVKVRMTGKYSNTRKITSTELKALKDVLLAYDVLKTEMEQKNKEKLENLEF